MVGMHKLASLVMAGDKYYQAYCEYWEMGKPLRHCPFEVKEIDGKKCFQVGSGEARCRCPRYWVGPLETDDEDDIKAKYVQYKETERLCNDKFRDFAALTAHMKKAHGIDHINDGSGEKAKGFKMSLNSPKHKELHEHYKAIMEATRGKNRELSDEEVTDKPKAKVTKGTPLKNSGPAMLKEVPTPVAPTSTKTQPRKSVTQKPGNNWDPIKTWPTKEDGTPALPQGMNLLKFCDYQTDSKEANKSGHWRKRGETNFTQANKDLKRWMVVPCPHCAEEGKDICFTLEECWAWSLFQNGEEECNSINWEARDENPDDDNE